ncbi:MAG: rod shape-determining protein MreD [Lachnospiraceae bacterium]|nr:rod shape-determining protein MreD [Lachnospiraceae bacterium]
MKRIIAYVLIILAAFFLQNNVFAASSLISTVPNILMIVVFSFGFIRGSTEGMLIGFFCGLLSDLFFSNVIGFSALLYSVLGYLMGLLGRLYYTDFVDLPLILCLLSNILYHIGNFFFAFLLRGKTGFGAYFTGIMLPELLYTGLMTLLLYPLFRRLEGAIEKWETRKTHSYA